MSELTRPATLSVHFLRPGSAGPVEVRARSRRRGRRSESVSAALVQDGKEIAASLAAFVDGPLPGLDHDFLPFPTEMPGKSAWRSVGELRDGYGLEHDAVWDQLEVRLERWDERDDRDPSGRAWFRFHPTASFSDALIDACRVVVAADTVIASAGVRAHTDAVVGYSHFPVTVDLNVAFHHAPKTEWLFGEVESSISTEGLMAGTVRMWNDDGMLCGTALSTMLWLSDDAITGPRG